MYCNVVWLRSVLRATTACTFSTSQLPKVVRPWCVLYILTWKCASRHNGVNFFDISTSKSRPSMVCFVHFDLEICFAPQRRALFRHLNFQKWSDHGVFRTFWLGNVLRATTACTFSTSQLPKVVRSWCFVHFDLEMCFAPQRRALFRHLNFQKWSEPGVFCTFCLGNVLRATTACTFSTSQLPKVVRTWGVLYLLTWKCASRHNGVQFFIAPVASWLRTRRFSEPTFRPSWAPNHWKNTVFRDFPTFSRICIFCPLTLSLLLFSLLLSASALLCFSSVHIVGSLTSKLPSIMENKKCPKLPTSLDGWTVHKNRLWIWDLLHLEVSWWFGVPLFFHPFLMACSIIKHSSGQIIVLDKPETKLYWENFPYEPSFQA